MAKFLTKDEELALGVKVQAMLQAKKTLENDGLDASKKHELSVCVVEGNRAVDSLLQSNMRLVYKRARAFKQSYPNGPELEDMIQDGMAGLMNGILRYDPSRNNKLSTVATYWIFQSISRQANRVGRLVKLPENRVSEYSEISKMRKALAADGFSGNETDDMIMTELKLSKLDFHSIINAAEPASSLNYQFVDSSNNRVCELMDVVVMENEPSPEGQVIRDAMQTVLEDAMGSLSEVQRDVLNSSFAFSSMKGKAMSAREVKAKHKITTEVFRSHLADALSILKKDMDFNGVTYDDFIDNRP